VDTTTGDDLDVSTVDRGGSHRGRLYLERFTGQTLVNKLRTFEAAALRGVPFGIVADTTDSWAAFAQSSTIAAGGTSILCNGNAFLNWSSVTTLTSADTVVIHSSNPEYRHEQKTVNSFSLLTGLVDFSSSQIAYKYDVGPIVIRHQYFLPFCYLDPGARSRPILTSDHGINYTLDLQALYSPAGMRRLYSDTGGQGLLIGETHPGQYPEGTLQGVQSTGPTGFAVGGTAPRF
jgi:hypothetical protein